MEPSHISNLPTAAAERTRSDSTQLERWRCLTVIDAARYLSVSRSQLYVLLDTGQLASLHIGRSRRIPLIELERFIAQRLSRRSDARAAGSPPW